VGTSAPLIASAHTFAEVIASALYFQDPQWIWIDLKRTLRIAITSASTAPIAAAIAAAVGRSDGPPRRAAATPEPKAYRRPDPAAEPISKVISSDSKVTCVFPALTRLAST
jgi:hypothetical protein